MITSTILTGSMTAGSEFHCSCFCYREEDARCPDRSSDDECQNHYCEWTTVVHHAVSVLVMLPVVLSASIRHLVVVPLLLVDREVQASVSILAIQAHVLCWKRSGFHLAVQILLVSLGECSCQRLWYLAPWQLDQRCPQITPTDKRITGKSNSADIL